MFAVIRTGSKQYKVKAGDVLKIEKLEGNDGDVVLFDDVLAVGDQAGVNLKAGDTKVSAEIVNHAKDDKVIIFKKKRRHNYRRKRGHRQAVTWVKIQEIGSGLKAKKSEKKAEAPKAEKPVAKPAAKKAAAPKKAAEAVA